MPEVRADQDPNRYNLLKLKRELVQTALSNLIESLIKMAQPSTESTRFFNAPSSQRAKLNYGGIIAALNTYNQNYQQTPSTIIQDFIEYLSSLSASEMSLKDFPALNKELETLKSALTAELTCMKQHSVNKITQRNNKLDKVGCILAGIAVLATFSAIVIAPNDNDDDSEIQDSDTAIALLLTGVGSGFISLLSQTFKQSTDTDVEYDYIITGNDTDIETHSTPFTHNPLLNRTGYDRLRTAEEISAPPIEVEAVAIGNTK